MEKGVQSLPTPCPRIVARDGGDGAGVSDNQGRAEAIGVENDFVAVRELGPRTVSMSLILTSCP